MDKRSQSRLYIISASGCLGYDEIYRWVYVILVYEYVPTVLQKILRKCERNKYVNTYVNQVYFGCQ